MSEYSIADFLKALTDDDLEKKMIQLISKGHVDDDLLVKLLEILVEKKNDNL